GKAAVQPRSIPRQVAGLAPGQQEFRVLIAEDNPDNLAILHKLLEDVGFIVRAAHNGAEAVQYFQEWKPCFIWMDRRMPVMDGLTATRKIRDLPGGRKVKIVALTASVFKEQREEILNGGADDFVGKPFIPSEIFDCMSTHLDLRFQYLEQNEEVKKAAIDITALEQLPVDLLQKLHKAFVLLDRDLALDEIGVVANINPALAETLAEYVDNMEFDQPCKTIARVRNKMQG
ncbi:MAG: response regulator, partial [Candidatus Electrothrix sp. ATG2]|nr:response regulator [Candidatus Electrothrix sp. ATG2]